MNILPYQKLTNFFQREAIVLDQASQQTQRLHWGGSPSIEFAYNAGDVGLIPGSG